MRQKLDPRMLELLERSDKTQGELDTVQVLLAIDAPLSVDTRDDLIRRGLSLRTEAGTVLTGSVRLRNIGELEDSPHVVQIELSAPQYLDKSKVSGAESDAEQVS